MDGGKKKNRIGWIMIIILLIIAYAVDNINPIPIIGGIITTFYWLAFSFYLFKTGHGLLNYKNIVPGFLSVVIEWLPAVSIIPTVLISTAIIIIFSRIEDRMGISLLPMSSPGNRPARNIRKPVNSTPGIRMPNRRRESEEISLTE